MGNILPEVYDMVVFKKLYPEQGIKLLVFFAGDGGILNMNILMLNI